MDLIDSHCHIQLINSLDESDLTTKMWQKLGLTLDQVVANAFDQDVKTLIVVGCNDQDSQLAVNEVKNRANCYASIGIHPHEAEANYPEMPFIEHFQKLLDKKTDHKIVAIGECGLDYYYNKSTKTAQKALLKAQLQLASKYNLPVIFHVRNAFMDFIDIYEEYANKVTGVLHSYTDSLINLQTALKLNLYIGVNGIATFNKDPNTLAMFKAIPLNRLILETDSPYLTPIPFRGRINEPKNIKVIAEFMAELHNIDYGSIAKTTTENARNFFKI